MSVGKEREQFHNTSEAFQGTSQSGRRSTSGTGKAVQQRPPRVTQGSPFPASDRQTETPVRIACECPFNIRNVYIVTNMESRFPTILVLWLGREFYRGKYGMTGSSQAWTLDHSDKLGGYFGVLETNLATLETNR
ncbi:hypothetical protein AVEN_41582-1 [Araneus ventricosus]|uniref:Uncharacterized protein n=1 Tax=Araneus ventricosus TaxID=182803 RepID=A0A4Y2LXY3_ARAVE|nr:hypothetical protein AVEN_41582-1 [Araneus ventricosus]